MRQFPLVAGQPVSITILYLVLEVYSVSNGFAVPCQCFQSLKQHPGFHSFLIADAVSLDSHELELDAVTSEKLLPGA